MLCQLILGIPIRTILSSAKNTASKATSEIAARFKQFEISSLIRKQNIVPAIVFVTAAILVGFNISNASSGSSTVSDRPNSLLYDYLEKDVVTEKATADSGTASYQTVATLASASSANIGVATDVYDTSDDTTPDMAVSLSGQVLDKPLLASADTITYRRDKSVTHTVQPGETLISIARKYDLKLSTVLWANGLNTGSVVKPGQKLLILPVNGTHHVVKESDTLDSLAAKFKVKKEVIAAFNDLAGEQLPKAGSDIVIPGGSDPASLEPAPEPTPVRTTTRTRVAAAIENLAPVVRLGGGGGGHRFAYGYCTWYVAQKRYVPWPGNASAWPANARAYGYSEGKTPAAGAIYAEPWLAGGVGHVSYVERVNPDGSFLISEMNYAGWNKKSYRTVSAHPPGIFIY